MKIAKKIALLCLVSASMVWGMKKETSPKIPKRAGVKKVKADGFAGPLIYAMLALPVGVLFDLGTIGYIAKFNKLSKEKDEYVTSEMKKGVKAELDTTFNSIVIGGLLGAFFTATGLNAAVRAVKNCWRMIRE